MGLSSAEEVGNDELACTKSVSIVAHTLFTFYLQIVLKSTD